MNSLSIGKLRGIQQLADMADTYGSPWYRKMASKNGGFTPVAEGWYQSY